MANMENAEEVLQILDRFTRLKQKEIPKELDDYLQYVAKTGDTVFKWSSLKYLFREKLLNVIKTFHDNSPRVDDIPQYPNVDPFNYENMKSALLERLELFNAAPFTIQRLCELLIDPRKQYSRLDKFMRALEKNILVVSTVEPGRKCNESENGDSLDSVVNGDLSLDVNVDIDMEGESIFNMDAQNGNGKADPTEEAAAANNIDADVATSANAKPANDVEGKEEKNESVSPAAAAAAATHKLDDDILPNPKKAKLDLAGAEEEQRKSDGEEKKDQTAAIDAAEDEAKVEIATEENVKLVDEKETTVKTATEEVEKNGEAENNIDGEAKKEEQVEENDEGMMITGDANKSKGETKQADVKPQQVAEEKSSETSDEPESKLEGGDQEKKAVAGDEKADEPKEQPKENNQTDAAKTEAALVKDQEQSGPAEADSEMDGIVGSFIEKQDIEKAEKNEVAAAVIALDQSTDTKLANESLVAEDILEKNLKPEIKEIAVEAIVADLTAEVKGNIEKKAMPEASKEESKIDVAEISTVKELLSADANANEKKEKDDEIKSAPAVVAASIAAPRSADIEAAEEAIASLTTQTTTTATAFTTEAIDSTVAVPAEAAKTETVAPAEAVAATATITEATAITAAAADAAVAAVAVAVAVAAVEVPVAKDTPATTPIEIAPVAVDSTIDTVAIVHQEDAAVAAIEEDLPLATAAPMISEGVGIGVGVVSAALPTAAIIGASVEAPSLAINDQPMDDTPPMGLEVPPTVEEVVMAESGGSIDMATDAMEPAKDEPAGMDVDDTSQEEAMDQ